MCDRCVEWGGKRWHRYGDGYYERTDKSVKPKRTLRLHRERWLAEVGVIPDGWHVHHRDEDKGRNELGNLECVPKGEHQRHHILKRPIPPTDWAERPAVECVCVVCDGVVMRKRVVADVVCLRCQQIRADAKRVTDKRCICCGEPFRSRAGNLCSQRCVNVATRGATTCVLPDGRRRAGVFRKRHPRP